MAIVPVSQVEQKKKQSGFNMGAIGGILSLIPHPAAKAAGVGLSLLSQNQAANRTQQPEVAPVATVETAPQQELDMPDRTGALLRRSDLQQTDPLQSLTEARDALAALDLDPEARARLQQPLDLALQAQRRV